MQILLHNNSNRNTNFVSSFVIFTVGPTVLAMIEKSQNGRIMTPRGIEVDYFETYDIEILPIPSLEKR